MDNSIGSMFITLLNAAMQPLVERIETLEKDLLIQDKAIAELEKVEAQPYSSTPAGVLTSLMEALQNGAGPYHEFCQYLEDSIQESYTIRTLKEQLPGDTGDMADALFASYRFKDQLIDLIKEETPGITESDAREYANEEIDSRDFIDEDKLGEKVDEKVKEALENVTVTLSIS